MAIGSKVNFYQRTQSEINAISSSDDSGIYFAIDTQEIYKGKSGSTPIKYTGIFIVSELPINPIYGKMYLYQESLYIYVGNWVQISGGGTATDGVVINGKGMCGIKNYIESSDVMEIPEKYEYNCFLFSNFGTVNCYGTINIM